MFRIFQNEFIKKFGYLNLVDDLDEITSANSSEIPAELSVQQTGSARLTRIIQEIQRYGGLNVTGELDKSTIKVIVVIKQWCSDSTEYFQTSIY